MAKGSRWEQSVKSIGTHLKTGSSTIAHAWEVRGRGFFSFMHEGDKANRPPVHGPYENLAMAKAAAEKGNDFHTIPLARP